jgi:hypothetical protein
MARAPALPERLRYLQPFRKKFATLPPEELNEGSGADPLFALFSKRIKGLSPIQAEKILKEDEVALRDWLSAPTHQNDPLQFAIGVFYIYSPPELVKHLLEELKKQPEPKLFANEFASRRKIAPSGGCRRRRNACLLAGFVFCHFCHSRGGRELCLRRCATISGC